MSFPCACPCPDQCPFLVRVLVQSRRTCTCSPLDRCGTGREAEVAGTKCILPPTRSVPHMEQRRLIGNHRVAPYRNDGVLAKDSTVTWLLGVMHVRVRAGTRQHLLRLRAGHREQAGCVQEADMSMSQRI